MSITITTTTQLDTFINNMKTHIQANVVTNIPDYDLVVKDNLTALSYKLTDKAFRVVPIEGVLMLFKKRHGLVLPSKSDFYIVNATVTPQTALQEWCTLQTYAADKNPIRFVTDHLAYYYNFNTDIMYQFTIPTLTLTLSLDFSP